MVKQEVLDEEALALGELGLSTWWRGRGWRRRRSGLCSGLAFAVARLELTELVTACFRLWCCFGHGFGVVLEVIPCRLLVLRLAR